MKHILLSRKSIDWLAANIDKEPLIAPAVFDPFNADEICISLSPGELNVLRLKLNTGSRVPLVKENVTITPVEIDTPALYTLTIYAETKVPAGI